MAIFMATIDSSIVNISLATLEHRLDTNFALIQWVVLSYLLVITGLVLVFARLGDMLGKKRLYLIGFVIFTIGSALCGAAPNIGFLIGFRALQGIGAAILQALGIAIVTETFPREERGKALGIVGSLVSIGIAVGPSLGGLLIGTLGWRSIFLVNLPIGVVGVYLAWRFVPNILPQGRQHFDRLGAFLLTITLLCFSLGMTIGQRQGFSRPLVLGLLGASLVGLAAFVSAEQRTAEPMINLRLFRNPLFSINLYAGVSMFIVVSGSIIFPFYLQNVRDYPIEKVGLMMVAFPVMLGLLAPVSGTLSDRFGTRGIALMGLILCCLASLAISTLHKDTPDLGFILRLMLLGAGIGMFQSPNNSAIMGAAPSTQLGVVSGLLATTRNVGQSIGLPIMGAIFATRTAAIAGERGIDLADAPARAIVGGIQAAYLFAAGLILLAALISTWGIHLERKQNRLKAAASAG
jgi:EmrB/QacA subfamily drug resistance transporter